MFPLARRHQERTGPAAEDERGPQEARPRRASASRRTRRRADKPARRRAGRIPATTPAFAFDQCAPERAARARLDRTRHAAQDHRSRSAPEAAASVSGKRRAQTAMRRLIRERDFRTAYTLAADHGLLPGEAFRDVEWTAGWIALQKLNDAPKAEAHFGTFLAGAADADRRRASTGWAKCSPRSSSVDPGGAGRLRSRREIPVRVLRPARRRCAVRILNFQHRSAIRVAERR